MARIGTAIWTSSEAVAHAALPRLMAALVDGDIRFHFEHGASGYRLTLPDLEAGEFSLFASSERIPLGGLYVDNTEI